MNRTLTRPGSIALAGTAFMLCYAGVVQTLASMWAHNAVYSYGFVLPFISAYVLASNWRTLQALDPDPDYLLGIPISLAGVALLVVGRLSAVVSAQEASLVVTATGLILLLFGRKVYACVWFPLAYLLLGTSIWNPVIRVLQPLSQVFSARIASSLLQLIGIPVLWAGTKIILPNITLEVMRECSGVNQVFAIVAMALPFGYLLLDGYVRRVTFVALSVSIAYLSNGVRIALIGFLAYRGLGNGDLSGVHVAEGVAVSAFGYLLMFASIPVLTRLGRRADRREGQATLVQAAGSASSHTVTRRSGWLEFATLLVVLSAGAFQLLFSPADVRLSEDLRTFPSSIGEWTVDLRPEASAARFPAIDDDFVSSHPSETGERRFTDADDELVRAYRNAAGERVRLYIGYHRSQSLGKELAGEASRALGAAASPVRLAVGSEMIELNQIVQERPADERGMLYWYDFNGRVVDNMYLGKLYMVWDAVTRGRTNGAVVMVAWEHPKGRDADASRKEAIAFVQAVMPLLPHYIPS